MPGVPRRKYPPSGACGTGQPSTIMVSKYMGGRENGPLLMDRGRSEEVKATRERERKLSTNSEETRMQKCFKRHL